MGKQKSGPRLRPPTPQVSQQMARMPTVGSGPEMAIRRELHSRGLRFRVAPCHLPGRPDLAFTRARLAVFVDGCFWHACPLHCSVPKSNREWWIAKFTMTRERDERKDAGLASLGWSAIHIWEHDPVQTSCDWIEEEWRRRLAER
jgi:DNA mismatch endonuclease (patch repair protein)